MTRSRLALAGLALTAAGTLSAQTNVQPGRPAVLGLAVSMALSGDQLFMGRLGLAPGFPMPPAETGSVHVFRRTASGWNDVGTVAPADVTLGDNFGAALATDGTLLIVGAPKANGGVGAVYAFSQRGGRWTQSAKLTPSAGAPGDDFGAAVALAGDVMLVAAPSADSARGAVYAFRRAGAGWQEAARLTASDRAAGDQFGLALDLQAGLALIGAPGPVPGGFLGGPSQLHAGAAYVFRAQGGSWTEAARLTAGGDSVSVFGLAVLLDGDAAWVSAPQRAGGVGAVYRFARSGDRWSLSGKATPASPVPGLVGSALARSGSDLFVGAPAGVPPAGGVLVFGGEGGTWTEKQRLSVPSIGLGNLLGLTLVASPTVVIAGGPLADFFEGAAYAFTPDAQGMWQSSATIVDRPAPPPAITGNEVSCTQGAARGYPCQDVDLLAFIPTSALGAKRGIMLNDLWGWTDPQTSREYALVGRMDGTSFVDVTNPQSPIFLGDLPLTAGARPNLWRDIKVYKNHAFIVADNAGQHGMQVFDLNQLRNVRTPPVTFTESARYDGIASAHNIVINESAGFAYAVGASGGGETCGGALHMIDIRDPDHPTFAGCYADPTTGTAGTGYTHDAQCVTYHGPDQRYQGREICFNSSETAVGIADVTDKASPKALAVASYPNVGYTHQGWLSDDQRYFYVDDELDEFEQLVPRTRTLIWDVADLEDPVLLTEYLGTTASSDHNLYVRGRYLYESNYVSGLRVIDVADPKNPVEVGYFDTVPQGENSPGFAGSWSNYPFFKSGTILVSSMREGLFVLRHRKMPLVP